jgi:hypothetical protein
MISNHVTGLAMVLSSPNSRDTRAGGR